MPDNDSYQADIANLDNIYQRAADNSGKPGFFKYLFKYFHVLSDNQQLSQAAFKFWLANGLEKYKDNEDVALEILVPVFGINPQLSKKQKIQELSNKQFKSSTVQTIKLFTSINSRLDKQRNKEVDPSYCFYMLYFNYYSVRNLDTNTLQKALDLLHNNPAKAKDLLKNELSEAEVLEVQKIWNNPEVIKEFKKGLKRVEDYGYIPNKDLLAEFTQDDFAFSLDVFHNDFKHWLSENWGKIEGEDSTEPRTEVELIFDENSIGPKVKVATGEEYSFSYMKPKTLEVIKYCYDRPGIPVGTNKFPEINFRKKGIINVLRGSRFYLPDGELSVFLTVSGSPKQLTLVRKRQVTDVQLQRIIKASIDSTSSQ